MIDHREHAGARAETFEVPGYNHFDIVHTLADPLATLGRLAYAQVANVSESGCRYAV